MANWEVNWYGDKDEPTLVELLARDGYKFEFEYGEYGYSWEITQVWSKDGHVFNLGDSGCSCNSFGDRWSELDEVIGEMAEVTSLPSLEECIPPKYSHWDISPENLQESYRQLGLR